MTRMRFRSLVPGVTLAVATLVRPAAAGKMPPDFKAVFEGTFYKGTFAVVVQEGIPTTSIYGEEGNETAAHYSIDVRNGAWRTSDGLLDTNQTAVDYLNRGEVMELKSMTWKDNRVDLRFESTEAHKVTRGNWLIKNRNREPVATNFKFFFPFFVTGQKDVPAATEYIGQYLRPFRSEDEARRFSAQFLAGAAAPSRPAAAPPAARQGPGTTASTKKEIKPGMTALEVIDILGKPQKEVAFQTQSKWTYPDMTVIFENGRVKEVRF